MSYKTLRLLRTICSVSWIGLMVGLIALGVAHILDILVAALLATGVFFVFAALVQQINKRLTKIAFEENRDAALRAEHPSPHGSAPEVSAGSATLSKEGENHEL